MIQEGRRAYRVISASRDLATPQHANNVVGPWRQSTYCPGCGEMVIGRDWHAIRAYRLEGDRCGSCGHRIAGQFDEAQGHWGRRRLPVRMSSSPRD